MCLIQHRHSPTFLVLTQLPLTRHQEQIGRSRGQASSQAIAIVHSQGLIHDVFLHSRIGIYVPGLPILIDDPPPGLKACEILLGIIPIHTPTYHGTPGFISTHFITHSVFDVPAMHGPLIGPHWHGAHYEISVGLSCFYEFSCGSEHAVFMAFW
jgi:hypothetical protein